MSELDNEQDQDRLNFPGGLNPNSGPPNSGPFGVANQVIQVPATLEIVQMF